MDDLDPPEEQTWKLRRGRRCRPPSPRPPGASTRRIRLSSAVTILSSADPRVFQEFATLDLLSGGRAEIMAGRGAFTESFPLFGYRLEDYETLFEEHLDLLLQVDRPAPVTWSGHHRPGALRRRPR